MTSTSDIVGGGIENDTTWGIDEETPYNVINNLVWYSYSPDYLNDVGNNEYSFPRRHGSNNIDDLSIISATSSCNSSIRHKMRTNQTNTTLTSSDQQQRPVLWFPGIYFPSHMCQFNFMKKIKNIKFKFHENRDNDDSEFISEARFQINMVSEALDPLNKIPVILILRNVIRPGSSRTGDTNSKDCDEVLEYIQQRVYVPTRNPVSEHDNINTSQFFYDDCNFLEKLAMIIKTQTSQLMGPDLYEIFQSSLKWIRIFMLYSCNLNYVAPGRVVPSVREKQYPIVQPMKNTQLNEKNESAHETIEPTGANELLSRNYTAGTQSHEAKGLSTNITKNKLNRISMESSAFATTTRPSETADKYTSPRRRQERRPMLDDETTTIATNDDENSLAISCMSPHRKMITTSSSSGRKTFRTGSLKFNASFEETSKQTPTLSSVATNPDPYSGTHSKPDINEHKTIDDYENTMEMDNEKLDCTTTNAYICDAIIGDQKTMTNVEEEVNLPHIDAMDSWSVVWTKLQFSGWYERSVDNSINTTGNIVYVRNHSGSSAVKNSDYFESISAVQDFIRLHCKHWIWTNEMKQNEKKEKSLPKNKFKKNVKKSKRVLSSLSTKSVTTSNEEGKCILKDCTEAVSTINDATSKTRVRAKDSACDSIVMQSFSNKKGNLPKSSRDRQTIVKDSATISPKDELSLSSGDSNRSSSSSSTDSLTSEQCNCFKTLWDKLKHEGWTYVKARNILHDWYYVPPNSEGLKGTVGIDYFQTPECVMKYCYERLQGRKQNITTTTANGRNGTKKRDATSNAQPLSKRKKSLDPEVPNQVAISSTRNSKVDRGKSKTKFSLNSSQEWWKHENIPSNAGIWPLLERMGYTINDGFYLLPSVQTGNSGTYIPRFKSLCGLRKFLCWKGIINYTDSSSDFSKFEHTQIQRWVRFANVPVAHTASVDTLKGLTCPETKDSIMRLLYALKFTSVDEKIFIPNADQLPGGRMNRERDGNYFDSLDSIRKYVRGAWMLGLDAIITDDNENGNAVVEYKKPIKPSRSRTEDDLLLLSLWGATSPEAINPYNLKKEICQWEVRYLEEVEDDLIIHSFDKISDGTQPIFGSKLNEENVVADEDVSCSQSVGIESESSIQANNNHLTSQEHENWYKSENLPHFLDVILPILKKMGFVYKPSKGYHHDSWPELHSTKDIELRQKLCKEGVPCLSTIATVITLEEQEDFRRWVAFANVPVNSSNSCTTLNKVKIPSDKKIKALLESKFGFTRKGDVYYPPGIDTTMKSDFLEAGIHFFNGLADVRNFIRASTDFHVDMNTPASRRPGRRGKTFATASEELQIRLWAALSPTPIPTQKLQSSLKHTPDKKVQVVVCPADCTPLHDCKNSTTLVSEADMHAVHDVAAIEAKASSFPDENSWDRNPLVAAPENASHLVSVMAVDLSSETLPPKQNCHLSTVQTHLNPSVKLNVIQAIHSEQVAFLSNGENEQPIFHSGDVKAKTASVVTQTWPEPVGVPGKNDRDYDPKSGQTSVAASDLTIDNCAICDHDKTEMVFDSAINKGKDVESTIRECLLSDPVYPSNNVNERALFLSCKTPVNIGPILSEPEKTDASTNGVEMEISAHLEAGNDNNFPQSTKIGIGTNADEVVPLTRSGDRCMEIEVETKLKQSIDVSNNQVQCICKETLLVTQAHDSQAYPDSHMEIETDAQLINSKDDINYKISCMDNEKGTYEGILLTQAGENSMEIGIDVQLNPTSDESIYHLSHKRSTAVENVSSVLLIGVEDSFSSIMQGHDASHLSSPKYNQDGNLCRMAEDCLTSAGGANASPHSFTPFLTQLPGTHIENDLFGDDHDIGF
jgi:hypothetical protein